MNKIRSELVAYKNYLMGEEVSLTKAIVMVERIIERVTELMETGKVGDFNTVLYDTQRREESKRI